MTRILMIMMVVVRMTGKAVVEKKKKIDKYLKKIKICDFKSHLSNK